MESVVDVARCEEWRVDGVEPAPESPPAATSPESSPSSSHTVKRPRRTITEDEKRLARQYRSKGWTLQKIGDKLGYGTSTIQSMLRHKPTTRWDAHNDLKEAITAVQVSRKQLREEQKQILMERFRLSTERVCDWIEQLIREGDPKGFAMAMQGIERMDRIAGISVGEGQKVEVSGTNGGPIQVDARAILARITEYVGRREAQ